MRKAVVIAFCLLTINALSQERGVIKNLPLLDLKKFHFGFTIGFNNMDFSLRESSDFLASNGDTGFKINNIYGIETQSNAGINLGPISNFRLLPYLDARMLIMLSFGQRNLIYRLKDTIDSKEVFSTHTMKIESTYIEFPIMLKYKAYRTHNYRPYIITGICPKLDLAARKKIKEEERPKIRIGVYDVFYEVGSGVDFYLPYFKFSVEMKFGYGLRNMLQPDGTNFTKAIDSLHSKIWTVSFHFEG